MLSATKFVSQRWNIKPLTSLILICVGSENQHQLKQNKGKKMTTNKTKKLNKNDIVKSFQNEMRCVLDNATQWYGNEYKTANERLYEMFADLYRIYMNLVDTKQIGNTEKREWIETEVAKRNITFKSKKPKLQELLIKYAFCVEGVECSKRISAYVRVFSIITQVEGVGVDNVVEWITANGGIEEIRQQSTDKSATKADRVEIGKHLLLNNFETQTNYTSRKTKQYASTKTNEVVLLVGVLNADGNVSVKHEIYAEETYSKIKGNTAINTALANVYSKFAETKKKSSAMLNAEKAQKEKANKAEAITASAKQVEEKQMEGALV